ncbi:MAG: hypothetical protein JNM69_30705 [Archangium sp.]|nr:hypothetical protein [Archangium sp.]
MGAPTGERLRFSANAIEYQSPPLQVVQPPPLVDSDAYVRDAVVARRAELSTAVAAAPAELRSHYARADADLLAAQRRFDALSASDRAACARVIQVALTRPRLNLKSLVSKLTSDKAQLAYGIALIAAGLYVLPVWGVAAAATGIAGAVIASDALPRVLDGLTTTFSTPLAPFEGGFSNSSPLLGTMTFVQGLPKVMPLRGKSRTIRRSDTTESGDVGDLARLVEEIERTWPVSLPEFQVPPLPPVFREPPLVAEQPITPADVTFLSVTSGINLVSREDRSDGIAFTFDDGTAGPGPEQPRAFEFMLSVVDNGVIQTVAVPGELIGRQGTLGTFELRNQRPVYVKRDLATWQRTPAGELQPETAGVTTISCYDPVKRRVYAYISRSSGPVIVGVDADTGQPAVTLPSAVSTFQLLCRRDGKLLIIEIASAAQLFALDVDTQRREPLGAVTNQGESFATSGVAYEPVEDRLFVVGQGSGPTATLRVFDATTGMKLKEISVATNLMHLFATPGRVYAMNLSTGQRQLQMTTITSGRTSVVGTLDIGSFQLDLRAHDWLTNLFYLVEDKRAPGSPTPAMQIVAFDVETGRRVTASPTTPEELAIGVHPIRALRMR